MEIIDETHEIIKKGERARLLFEMLLTEIGADFENTRNEIWDKLKKTQDDYNEALTGITEIIRMNNTKKTVEAD